MTDEKVIEILNKAEEYMLSRYKHTFDFNPMEWGLRKPFSRKPVVEVSRTYKIKQDKVKIKMIHAQCYEPSKKRMRVTAYETRILRGIYIKTGLRGGALYAERILGGEKADRSGSSPIEPAEWKIYKARKLEKVLDSFDSIE